MVHDRGLTWYPGGGGGASEKGYGRDGTGGQHVQPHGGDGLENDILRNILLVCRWWWWCES